MVRLFCFLFLTFESLAQQGLIDPLQICFDNQSDGSDRRLLELNQSLQYSYPSLFNFLSKNRRDCFSALDFSSEETFNLNSTLKEIESISFSSKAKTAIKATLIGDGIVIGTLMLLPTEISKWESDYREHMGESLIRAWTRSPVVDQDDWYINYIGHPIAGAGYYNLFRSQGEGPLVSFVYSVLASSFWEYGPEALCERPSVQDIWATPVIGSLMGELSHQATIKLRKNGFTTVEKIVITFINPAYVITKGYR